MRRTALLAVVAFAFAAQSAALVGQAVAPVPGDLAITELMANPKVVADNDGEYFELCNISTHAVDLANCSFGDITGSGMASLAIVTIVNSTILQPGEFCVFIRNYTTTGWTIAGQHVDYACGMHGPGCVGPSNMNLGNGADGDGIHMRDPSFAEMDAAGFGLVPSNAVFANVWAGIPAALAGTIFEGSSYERLDMRAPWVAGNVVASPTPLDLNGNFGTPAVVNSGDVTRPWFRAIEAVQPGVLVHLHMLSPRDGGHLVYAGASFSNVPTPVGPFSVDLQLDDLFTFATTPGNGVFDNFALSTLDAFGAGVCTVAVPNDPGLVGFTIYTQFVVIDAVGGLASLSDSLPLTVVP